MTDLQIRATLSSVIGSLDLANARLSRCEHGEQRDDVSCVRVDLKTASAELLVLRARLCGDRSTTAPHELFRVPIRVE